MYQAAITGLIINSGDLYSGGLYSGGIILGGGLIFGMRWALVHVVGLYTGGGLYSWGGLIVGGFRYNQYVNP
jgi:hypothetical protein